MLDNNQITLLDTALQRIFAMPLTKSTYREIQNALFKLTNGSKEKSNYILETLYRGQPLNDDKKNPINELVKSFHVLTKLSKEILETGEFISIITSDITNPNNRTFLINRIRKVDGEEFQFITDIDSTLHLAEHFLARLDEIKKQDPHTFAKNTPAKLKNLQTLLSELVK